MNKFITVEKGLFGYYLCLADDSGPIRRIEDWNYDTYEDAEDEGRKLAVYERIRFV